MKNFLLTLVFIAALGMAAEAKAHAVYAQNPAGVHPQVVAFEYATGDIPAYVQVEVYAPGDNEVEFQNGRTDALGRFSFTPNKAGVWAVVMSDGMGHQLRHEVLVPEEIFGAKTGAAPAATKPAAATSPTSTTWKALMGVSVLCNIFLGLHVWRRRATKANPKGK